MRCIRQARFMPQEINGDRSLLPQSLSPVIETILTKKNRYLPAGRRAIFLSSVANTHALTGQDYPFANPLTCSYVCFIYNITVFLSAQPLGGALPHVRHDDTPLFYRPLPDADAPSVTMKLDCAG